ncbi:MAG: hypothetical protein ACRD2O_08450 [Terriglobia bacterium]
MRVSRRQFAKEAGALALGGAISGTMLRELLANQQCGPQNPLDPQPACGGGGGGGGGGGTKTSPWVNWSDSFGGSATQTFDISHVTYSLAPIWQNYLRYGTLSDTDIANWNGALMAHMGFHTGSSSNYHYGAAYSMMFANIPPQSSTVSIPIATQGQITAMQNYVVDNFGLDLTAVPNIYSATSPAFIDPSFGTKTLSFGVTQVAANQTGGDQAAAANQGQRNPGACGAVGNFMGVLTVGIGLATAVGIMVPPAAPIAEAVAAAWLVDYAIAYVVHKELC